MTALRDRLPAERGKQIGAACVGGVTAVFAVLNLDKVEVNWILGTWSTPLIIVIAVSFALGAGGGYLFAGRRAKRRRARDPAARAQPPPVSQ